MKKDYILRHFQNKELWRAILLVLLLVSGILAENPSPPGTSAQPDAPNSAPLQVDAAAVLHHLNQIISWYRHSTTNVQSVGLPSDAIYQDNAKSLGTQAVRLAFDSAKAEAAILSTQQKASAGGDISQDTSQAQRLAQMESKTKARLDELQSQIDTLNAQISKTPVSKRENLIAQRDAAAGQMELQKALLDAIQKMAGFVENNGEMSSGLQGGINQLARSIPEVLGPGTSSEKKVTTPTQAKPSLTNAGGLISEAVVLYDYMSAVHQIDILIRETKYTRDVADHLRAPLRDSLRATIKQSESLATQASSDPDQLQSQRKNFQELTDRFKQMAGTLMPLSQEMIVLDDSRTNLEEWRSSIVRESSHVLRSVLLRVLGIAVALGVILILSEVWRRITFRYIGDPRRRRQFLVLRRVVIGFLITIVVILGFISEVSSLATFAGFITAGIAVGLQAVLLSVAAYFFIIGRYGIRVGDRISVAGVTGDVVDIGLVRLYLMELAGSGLDFHPTGRIVVFSNAVLFQAATPLFKQIPGTEYAWHEVVVKVAEPGNHKATEDKLMVAVTEVYSRYQHEIERQHANIERRVDIQVQAPQPEARLQFADTGLELLVRYPVDIRKASDIDEEMTRKILAAIESDAALKASVSGTPRIRSAIKG